MGDVFSPLSELNTKAQTVVTDLKAQAALRDRNRALFDELSRVLTRRSPSSNDNVTRKERTALQLLKVHSDRIRDENRNLSAALIKITGVVPFIPVFVQPPAEILLVIFRCSLPPPFFVDSSLHAGPDSDWCIAMRMKKSIIGVCKAWYEVGAEFLYEEVVLRRIGQIAAFRRTMGTTNLGGLVRRLTVDCFVPRGYANMFRTEMEYILQHCPSISRFDLTSPYLLPLTSYRIPFENLSISHLQYSRAVDFKTAIYSILALRFSLKALFWALPTFDTSLAPAVALEQLETLHINIDAGSVPSDMDLWMAKWHAPRLTQLAVVQPQYGSYQDSPFMGIHKAHGRGLEYLFLDVKDGWISNLQLLLDLCPSVQHLVLHFRKFQGMGQGIGQGIGQGMGCYWKTLISLRHPTIEWIEIFEGTERASISGSYDRDRDLLKRSFPSLRGFRRIDAALRSLPELLTALPSLCEGFFGIHRLSGYSLVNSISCLYREDADIHEHGIEWIIPTKRDADDSDSDADEDRDAGEGDNTDSGEDDNTDSVDSLDSEADPTYIQDEDKDSETSSWSIEDEDSETSSWSTESSEISDTVGRVEDEFYQNEVWEADLDSTLSTYLQTIV